MGETEPPLLLGASILASLETGQSHRRESRWPRGDGQELRHRGRGVELWSLSGLGLGALPHRHHSSGGAEAVLSPNQPTPHQLLSLC